MKILVVGASKGTGALVVKSALAKGHSVTAFARTPAKLEITNARLEKRAGDFHDAAAVKDAVRGHDAVVITASVAKMSEFKSKPDFFSRGTQNCIDGMKEHGVKRLVVLSASGAGDSRASCGWLFRTFVIDGILKRAYADHDVQERITKESGLEWVIARPTRLTDGAANGKYKREERGDGSVPNSISRADVADFFVEACESRDVIGKAYLLGG